MPADPGKPTAVSPLYLDVSTVRACLSDEELYEIVNQTLRESNSARVVKGPKSGFGVDIGSDHLHMGSVSGCVLSSSVAGIKWFTVSDKNPSKDLPRVPATILVCDAETGLLEGVLDGTPLTSERTAAMAVAAAAACSRRPLKHAAVIGAGAIGRALIKYLALTQPVEHIAVAALEESEARHACDATAAILRRNVSFCASSDPQVAVRDADVIFTATGVPVETDLVCAEWLKDDAIVCSLGSRREVDLDLIAQAWIIVDDIEGVKMRRSDFREGGIGWNRIAGDVASVMSGQLHPPPDAKRILLNLAGLGILDVALAGRAIANARRKGLGVQLEPGRG
ncbi:putative Ornithine cyclodeaminase [Bradyrhizobium vignae]|uniref:Putative Ornithine cyclodeaminase n=2 Tax=Bradyrhizobium vignae TaxID=1549949 RepID=A0A2U3Q9J5_9BRAD|nr:putative Ornithine cyclodeaminase [Bradyrhizobium vignae]